MAMSKEAAQRKKRVGIFHEEWVEQFFCCLEGENIKCLICSKVLLGISKFNIQRHYSTCHAEYKEIKGKH